MSASEKLRERQGDAGPHDYEVLIWAGTPEADALIALVEAAEETPWDEEAEPEDKLGSALTALEAALEDR